MKLFGCIFGIRKLTQRMPRLISSQKRGLLEKPVLFLICPMLALLLFFSLQCVTRAQVCDGNPSLDPENNCLPYVDDALEEGDFPSPTDSREREGATSACPEYGNNYFAVCDYETLQKIGNSLPLSGNYILINDIDATPSCGPGGCQAPSGAGFRPIQNFSGSFSSRTRPEGEPEVYTIDNLYINAPAAEGGVGLFGSIIGDASIRGIKLENAMITGKNDVGALVGRGQGGSSYIGNIWLERVSVQGEDNVGGLVGNSVPRRLIDVQVVRSSVRGKNNVGGMIGRLEGGSEARNLDGDNGDKSGAQGNHTYSEATVFGENNVGGLVGYFRIDDGARVNYWYSVGDVFGKTSNVGGLVGKLEGGGNAAGAIQKSYASGSVHGFAENRYSPSSVGGLIGYIKGAQLAQVRASGSVYGRSEVGGLAGKISHGGNIIDSYSSGREVFSSGGGNVGGFVGLVEGNAGIGKSYTSASLVKGTGNNVGGFVGKMEETATLRKVYTASPVEGDGEYVGALVGHCEASANNESRFGAPLYYRTQATGAISVFGGGDSQAENSCHKHKLINSNVFVGKRVGYLRDELAEQNGRGKYALSWISGEEGWGSLGSRGKYPCLRALPNSKENAAGDSGGVSCSAESRSTQEPPGTVYGLSVAHGRVVGDGEYEISWQREDSHGIVYKLEERMRQGADNWGSWSVVEAEGISSVTHYDFTRKDFGRYQYRVSACFGLGGGNAEICSSQTSERVSLSVSTLQAPRIVIEDEGEGNGVSHDGVFKVKWPVVLGATLYQYRKGKKRSQDSGSVSWSSVTNVAEESLNEDDYFLFFQNERGHATYVYQVRACNASVPCEDGVWSNEVAVSVHLASPNRVENSCIGVPSSLSNECFAGSSTLTWEHLDYSYKGEIYYEVQEVRMGDGVSSTLEPNAVQLGSTGYGVKELTLSGLSQGDSFYQVRACTEGGYCGLWTSEAHEVTIPRIVQPASFSLSDVGNSVIYKGGGSLSYASYVYEWDSVLAATSYEIQEYKSGTWSSMSGSSYASVCSDNEHKCDFNKNDVGEYKYKVRACNGSNCSDWVESQQSVLVKELPKVFGVSGTPTATLNRYTLSWFAVSESSLSVSPSYRIWEKVRGGAWELLVYRVEYPSQLRAENPKFRFSGKPVGTYSYRIAACISVADADTGVERDICGPQGEMAGQVEVKKIPSVAIMPTVDEENNTSEDGVYTLSWTEVTPVANVANQEYDYKLQESLNDGNTWDDVYNGSSASWMTPETRMRSGASNRAIKYRVLACTQGRCQNEADSDIKSLTVTVKALSIPRLSLQEKTSLPYFSVSLVADVAGARKYELYKVHSLGVEELILVKARRSEGRITWILPKKDFSSQFDLRVKACLYESCGEGLYSAGNLRVELTMGVPQSLQALLNSNWNHAIVKWEAPLQNRELVSYYKFAEILPAPLASSTASVYTRGVYSGSWEKRSVSFESLGTGTYTYSVEACDRLGRCGSVKSESLTVASSAVAVHTPENLRIVDGENPSYDTSHILEWDAVTGALSYRVAVRSGNLKGAGSLSSWRDSGGVRTNQKTFTISLDADAKKFGKYYEYRVRTCTVVDCSNLDSQERDFSRELGVRVYSLDVFDLESDENPSPDGSYSLSWGFMPWVSEYVVEETRGNSSSEHTIVNASGQNKREIVFVRSDQPRGRFSYKIKACVVTQTHGGNGGEKSCGEYSARAVAVDVQVCEAVSNRRWDGTIHTASCSANVPRLTMGQSERLLNVATGFEGAIVATCGPTGVVFSQSICQELGSGTDNSPFVIRGYEQLKEISRRVLNQSDRDDGYHRKRFRLGNEIDARASWGEGTSGCVPYDGRNFEEATCEGFTPIGNCGADHICTTAIKDQNGKPYSGDNRSFRGVFDGGGYAIKNLYMKRSTGGVAAFIGLLGSGGVVKNLGVTTIAAKYNGSHSYTYAAGLIGVNRGIVVNSYASGYVESLSTVSKAYVGGLLAWNDDASAKVLNSYAKIVVKGFAPEFVYAGGIVGFNNHEGSLKDVYSSGNVEISGENIVAGGLVGYLNRNGQIENSYSLSRVVVRGTAVNRNIGSIVGNNSAGGVVLGRNYYTDGEKDPVGFGIVCKVGACFYGTQVALKGMTISDFSWGSQRWSVGTSTQLPALKYVQKSHDLSGQNWCKEVEGAESTLPTCGDLLPGQRAE